MPDEDKELAAPFTDDLSKQEMIDHFRNAHNTYGYRGQSFGNAKSTRATKDQLIRAHDHTHSILDRPSEELVVHAQQIFVKGEQRQHTRTPTVPHTHPEPVLSSEGVSTLEAIRSGGALVGGKTLPSATRAALTRLVDNDFAALRTDLQQLAAQTWETRKTELELDWRERCAATAKFLVKTQKMSQQLQKKMNTLKAEAAEAGVTLTFGYHSSKAITAEANASGYDTAVKDAKQEHDTMLSRALLRLERERLRAQRRILLSAIPPEAAAVMEDIPSAEDMMRAAAAREPFSLKVPT